MAFRKLKKLKWFAAALALAVLSTPMASAEWLLLPQSRDQQYRTFGLFIDNQTAGLYMPNGSNVWLALGEQFALLENTGWYGDPQLVLYASVNAGDRLQGSLILMETIDIRAGFSYEFSFDKSSRMSISFMHQSGHTSDNIQDQELVTPNLGNTQLLFRYFHDIEDRFRLGGTLGPYPGIDPGAIHWETDEFAEWFPWGTASKDSKFTPFIAGGLQQWGPYSVEMTYHAQLGAYVGNHMKPIYKPNVRVVAGYYNGVDPRFKYAQFLNGLQRFYYFGVEAGL